MRRFELLLAIYRYVLAILRKKKKKKQQNRGGSIKNTKMRMTRERRKGRI